MEDIIKIDNYNDGSLLSQEEEYFQVNSVMLSSSKKGKKEILYLI